MTLDQFEIMRKAHEYKQVDLDYRIHQLAYLSFVATGTKKAGKNKEKPIFSTFKKFFDYDKALKKVSGKVDEGDQRLINAFRKAEGK